MKQRLLLLVCSFLLTYSIDAQLDINYWQYSNEIRFGMGMVMPQNDFREASETGAFAGNGMKFDIFSYSRTVTAGVSIGADIGWDFFTVRKKPLRVFSQARQITSESLWNQWRFGLNVRETLPFQMPGGNFLNVFGSFKGGFRRVGMPKMTLHYNPVDNRYTSLTYSGRKWTNYLGFAAGIQYMFNNVVGLEISVDGAFGENKELFYTIDSKTAQGVIAQREDFMMQSFDYIGALVALTFRFD